MLNKHLANREYIGADYSIADMACYPWIVPHEKQLQNLDSFPNLKEWFFRMQNRPAVQRAYEKAKTVETPTELTEEAKKELFNNEKK